MEDKSGNMYSYQDDQKSNIIKTDAIRRSLGNKNPNNIPVINNNINNNNNNKKFEMKEGANSMEDKSGNMYSYRDDQKSGIIKTDALRRSLGNKNPNNDPVFDNGKGEVKPPKEYQEDDDTITIHIDQSPPPYWMFFIVFALIQIIRIFSYTYIFSV